MGKVKIHFVVTGSTRFSKDRDYYTARCNELKLTTYGNTSKIAERRMKKALNLWANTIGNNNLLPKRLAKLGIPFDTSKDTVPETSCWTVEAAGVGA